MESSTSFMSVRRVFRLIGWIRVSEHILSQKVQIGHCISQFRSRCAIWFDTKANVRRAHVQREEDLVLQLFELDDPEFPAERVDVPLPWANFVRKIQIASSPGHKRASSSNTLCWKNQICVKCSFTQISMNQKGTVDL